MSTLITIAAEASVHATSVQAAGGILDWATNFNTSAQTLIKGIAVTIGVVFVIVRGIASRGSMAAIVVAAIAAALFVAVVFNIPALKDTVQNDLPGASAVVQTVTPTGLLGI